MPDINTESYSEVICIRKFRTILDPKYKHAASQGLQCKRKAALASITANNTMSV